MCVCVCVVFCYSVAEVIQRQGEHIFWATTFSQFTLCSWPQISVKCTLNVQT